MSTERPARRYSRHIGFECRVCETRLHARPEDVGRKVKCPDCGAATVVPRPPQERLPKPPAAMEGEQYETWPLDQQPSAAQLRTSQPKLVAFECSLCGTRLSATLDQVGELTTCPDCGAKSRVPSYEEEGERTHWREDDGEELDLEVVSGEPRRTTSVPGVTDLAEDADHAATPADPGESIRITEYSTRPELARWPLQTRIALFPLSQGVPVRLILFAAWASLAVWIAYFGLSYVAGYGAIIAMFLLAASAILGMMCFASLAACWLTIITESSEGNDAIEAWPDMVFLDWMFDGFYIVMAALVGCLPGWLVSLPWQDEPLIRMAMILGGAVLFFPVVLLSMLDVGSPLAPLSPKIVLSFLRAPVSWLMFLVESAVLVGALAAAGLALVQDVPLGLVYWMPLVVLGSLWYFRLLGRLAWVLSEVTVSEFD